MRECVEDLPSVQFGQDVKLVSHPQPTHALNQALEFKLKADLDATVVSDVTQAGVDVAAPLPPLGRANLYRSRVGGRSVPEESSIPSDRRCRSRGLLVVRSGLE
jgi:hypothetical protein